MTDPVDDFARGPELVFANPESCTLGPVRVSCSSSIADQDDAPRAKGEGEGCAVTIDRAALVEKAWAAFGGYQGCGASMEDAVNAIFPDIIEACAKVADEYSVFGMAEGTAERIAHSIRALAQDSPAP